MRSLQLVLFLIFLVFTNALAQDQPVRTPLSHSIQSYHDANNRLFINQHQSYRFFFSGEATKDSESLSPENSPLTTLSEGETEFQIHKADGSVFRVPLIVDGTAPHTELELLNAPTFQNEHETFVGKGLKIGIEASDNSSGVQQILWAINNNPFNPFRESEATFTVDGSFLIYHYAVDQVGNVEPVQYRSFEIDVTGPVVTHQLEGPQQLSVTSSSSSISLSAEDAGAGTKHIFFWFDDEPAQRYSTTISLSNLEDGEHSLYAYATDNVENAGDTLIYPFYLDRNAPEIREQITGNIYNQSGTLYISAESQIALETNDNKSGTSWIRYQVNQDGERTYTQPIRLSEISGTYAITYSVADIVGNVSEKKSFKVYVDNNAPQTNLRFEGYYSKSPEGYAINPNTAILLDASDLESGIREISYRLNEGNWQTYSEPISFSETGSLSIQYRSTDQVQNQEEIKEIRLLVIEESEALLSEAAPEKPTLENSAFLKKEQEIQGPHKEVFLWLSASPSDTSEKFMLSYSDDGSKFPLLLAPNSRNTLAFNLEELENLYPVTIDGSSPISTLTASGAKSYTKDKDIIFAPGVSLSLSATDNISGVKEIYTSENGGAYQKYESPLRGYYAEQKYNIRYYADDLVGNSEEEKTYSFNIDATPPISNHQFLDNYSGANLSRYTTLKVTSDDNLAGVDTIYIQLNDNRPVMYAQEIQIGDLGEFNEPFNTISYFAVDKVGNTEQRKQFNFKMDKVGPVAKINWQGRIHKTESITFIHPSTLLTLEAEDSEMEIRESWYRFEDSDNPVTYNSPVSLSDFNRVSIEYSAIDILGNQGNIEKETVFIDGDDPVSSYLITGQRLETGTGIILGSDAEISFTASDNASGVAQINYSVNSENLQAYSSPVQFRSSGSKIVRYEAIDNVGNVESVNILNLVYDQTAPEIDLSFSESPVSESATELRILPQTLVTIKSTDRHTEVKSVEYRLDDGGFSTYFRPIPFSESGKFTLTIKAEDLLGNETQKMIDITVE